MAWSTRQLAELAGTTVKAVRYAHDAGLLEQPERAANGYKQYTTRHLVRLLQVRRLSALGLQPARIAELEHGGAPPEGTLEELDRELQATIARLEGLRAEIARIRSNATTLDLPDGFGDVEQRLSAADAAFLHVSARVLDDEAVDSLREIMREERMAVDDEFDALPADADEAARADLAERYAPGIRRLRERHPWLADAGAHAPRGAAYAQEAVGHALVELYNPAQLEVLARVHRILQADEGGAATPG